MPYGNKCSDFETKSTPQIYNSLAQCPDNTLQFQTIADESPGLFFPLENLPTLTLAPVLIVPPTQILWTLREKCSKLEVISLTPLLQPKKKHKCKKKTLALPVHADYTK
eukprot:TRINITY_DN14_c1_g1_i10.p1 TRINITY_DN14_c1_g1~~TRINITY_DN14_c1_g1_i10.p1  ORF type:complete len:109 (-),score=14.61 TRINITY_DN14_c1_g1_i10:41-367(-)